MTDKERLVLRVVAGPLDGAEIELGDAPTFVGHGWRNDIVVRDPSAKGVRLRWDREGEVAAVTVLEGEIGFLGQTVAAPQSVVAPAFTPLFLGDAAIAFGRPDAKEWARCAALVGARARSTADEAPADPWSGPSGWMRALAERGLIDVRAPAIAAAVVLGVAASSLAWPRPSVPDTPTAVRADVLAGMLESAGFFGLAIGETEDGSAVVITGVVADESERARLEALLAVGGPPSARLEVAAAPAVAQAIEDIFRLNGVDATVAHVGGGVFEAHDVVASDATVEAVRAALATDAPLVRELRVEATPPPDLADNGRYDPSKRVVTLVGGPNGYVVTDDGSKYFEGATLPTGHRIVSVTSNELVVEDDTRRTAYAF
jgi:hypothetical protein